MNNDLKVIALLALIDFFFSYGVYHLLSCLLKIPAVFVGAIGCGLTIIANFCILAICKLI